MRKNIIGLIGITLFTYILISANTKVFAGDDDIKDITGAKAFIAADTAEDLKDLSGNGDDNNSPDTNYEPPKTDNIIKIDKDMDLFDNIYDTVPVAVIGPQNVTLVEKEGDWALIETWLGEKWVNLGAIRKTVRLDVPAYNQQTLGYPTGCEIVSTAMMINCTKEADVHTLAAEMPYSSDVNEGFRGSPSSESGFTIFPQALLSLTEKYLGNAEDMSGCEITDIKEKLNADSPVVVWINGMGFNVHAICLTGYDEDGFYYNDPWTGKKDVFIKYDSFYGMWNKPVYDSIYRISYPARKALSYDPSALSANNSNPSQT